MLLRALGWIAFAVCLLGCDPCKSSCKSEGRCGREGIKCVADSDDACKKSDGCKSGGRCTYDAKARACVGGATAAAGGADSGECAKLPGCAEYGACGSVQVSAGKVEEFGTGGVDVTKAKYACGPTKPEHCKASATCKRLGQCTLQGKECVVGADADCKASAECADRGRCVMGTRNRVCSASTDAECAASKECATHGHCAALKGSMGDVEACGPKDDAVCKKTPQCKSEGLCSMVPTGRGYSLCLPGSDADCKQSDACKTGGRCRKVDRSCQK